MSSSTTASRAQYPRTLDEVSVRLVAGVVLVVALVAAATGWWWLFAPLLVDFALRTAVGPRASPVAQLVRVVVRPRVSAKPRPTAGPPKRFAAAMGTAFSAAIVVLGLTVGWTTPTWVVVAVMVLFPFLESVLGFCAGCRVFGLLMRAGVIPEEVCLDCADITRRRPSSATA